MTIIKGVERETVKEVNKMMYTEFNIIMASLHRNYKEVSVRLYRDVVEPMYMSTNISKTDFCEMLNIKALEKQDNIRCIKLLEKEIKSAVFQFNQNVINGKKFVFNKVDIDWEVIELIDGSVKPEMNNYQLEYVINRMLYVLFEKQGRKDPSDYILEKVDGMISHVRILNNGSEENMVL